METQAIRQNVADDKKKIIIAITKSNFGGAQKYIYTLQKELKNKGFLVKVLLGGDGVLNEKLKADNTETIKINSLQRNISIIRDFQVFFEILKILKMEKPDVFHVNSSKIGGIGALAGRLVGIKKIIFTAHGFAFNENRGVFSKLMFKFFYWITFLLSHKTIFVSFKTQEQAPTFLLTKSKFKVIYNAILPIDFHSKEEARNILINKNHSTSLMASKKWIGTLAELHHIKGIDLLIDSAKEILKTRNDLQFIVFGEGEEKEKLINESKTISDNFILFGQLKDASKYLKALDLFVLPSRSEAMPLSILEAMQAQIPIIASNVGGISEMIPNECLIEKGNTKQLQEKILKGINSTPNYDLSKFSLEKMIDETTKIYFSK